MLGRLCGVWVWVCSACVGVILVGRPSGGRACSGARSRRCSPCSTCSGSYRYEDCGPPHDYQRTRLGVTSPARCQVVRANGLNAPLRVPGSEAAKDGAKELKEKSDTSGNKPCIVFRCLGVPYPLRSLVVRANGLDAPVQVPGSEATKDAAKKLEESHISGEQFILDSVVTTHTSDNKRKAKSVTNEEQPILDLSGVNTYRLDCYRHSNGEEPAGIPMERASPSYKRDIDRAKNKRKSIS